MDAADWSILADSCAAADDVGSAVTRIVASVAARLSLESSTASVLHHAALPDFSPCAIRECLSPSDTHDVSIDN